MCVVLLPYHEGCIGVGAGGCRAVEPARCRQRDRASGGGGGGGSSRSGVGEVLGG